MVKAKSLNDENDNQKKRQIDDWQQASKSHLQKYYQSFMWFFHFHALPSLQNGTGSTYFISTIHIVLNLNFHQTVRDTEGRKQHHTITFVEDKRKETMKWSAAVLISLLAGSEAFSTNGNAPRGKTVVASAVDEAVTVDSKSGASTQDPLLIRAARGEKTERTPVWMMRQAGRHIQEYRDLCKKYPTFRQRSEIPDVAVEVSLQPWRNYQTDGCILFSDILTPLPGVGCDFTIDEKLGPIMEPIKNWDDMKKVISFESLFPVLLFEFSNFFWFSFRCIQSIPPQLLLL